MTSDLDLQADGVLDWARARGMAPTRENLQAALSDINEYADRLLQFCRDHGVPPTEFNLRMALGVLRALAQNTEEK